MQGGEDDSIEQVVANLSAYKDQLREVKKLLVDDPGNSEYVEMEKQLEEPETVPLLNVQLIALTEELLATMKETEDSVLISQLNADATSSHIQFDGAPHFKLEGSELSESHEKFSIGAKVQAVWSEDGEWYDATIDSLTPNGYYISYDGWGNKEEVDPGNVRGRDALLEAERDAEATKQAIKRKIAQAAEVDFQSRSLPAKLRIDPNDPEDVKAAKRKKIHAFKSKVRFEHLEVVQNKRQNAWQQFQTTKGKTKKVGFFSGRKRESIFKSPEDVSGKVGVTGSGKGLTDFQKREKHLHLKGGTVDTEE